MQAQIACWEGAFWWVNRGEGGEHADPPGPVSWAWIPEFSCLTPHRPLYPQKRIQVLVLGPRIPAPSVLPAPHTSGVCLMPVFLLLFLLACSVLGFEQMSCDPKCILIPPSMVAMASTAPLLLIMSVEGSGG